MSRLIHSIRSSERSSTRNIARFFLVLCLSSIVFGSNFSNAQSGDGFFRCLKANFFKKSEFKKIQRNRFQTGRTLNDYIANLDPGFKADLDALQFEDQWVDAGAGDANAAQEYLNNGGLGHVTALAAAIPRHVKSAILRFSKQNTQKFRYLEGRLIEETPASWVGRSRLITDVWGPLAYSSNPIAVLQKYLEFLEPGGKIYAFNGSRGWMTIGGKRIIFNDWLASQSSSHLRITHHSGQLVIERLDDTPIELPTIKLVSAQRSTPPVYYFELTQ